MSDEDGMKIADHLCIIVFGDYDESNSQGF